MVTGAIAAMATLAAMKFDLWGEALPVQLVASIIAVAAAILGWRAGVRTIVVAGLVSVALSWVPLGFILYSCAVLKNCP